MFRKIDSWIEPLIRKNILFWILGITIILRLPSLFEPYWYGDEAIYLALGEGVRQGLTLYKDVFDHKPPLIYLVAAISGSLFWFKFLLLINHIATIVLFWKLAKKLFSGSVIPESRQNKSVILAVTLFAVFTTLPTLEGNIANAELFLALPIIGGFYYVFTRPILTLGASAKQTLLVFKHLFLSGLIFSLAILYKVPAAFEVAALVAFWWIINISKLSQYPKLIGQTIVLSLGILVPILLTGLYYFFQDALTQYVQAGLSQNLGYIASWSAPVVSQDKAFTGDLIFRGEVLAGVLVFIILFRKYFDKTTLFVSVWFSFALFAMLLSGRPYPHYIIQAVAPLSLLVAILVNGIQKQRFWTTPFILIFLVAVNFYQFYYYPTISYYKNFITFVVGNKTHNQYLAYFDQRIPRTYKLAQFLVSSTTPRDKVFIWGTEPELYALARRLPPGRLVTSFHIIDFAGTQETMDSLKNNPPKYILLSLKESRDLPGLRTFMQSNYIYLESLEDIEIWKRVSPEVIKAIKQQ